jgi:hypothetical protein
MGAEVLCNARPLSPGLTLRLLQCSGKSLKLSFPYVTP